MENALAAGSHAKPCELVNLQGKIHCHLRIRKLNCPAGQGLWSGDRSRDFSTPAANQFVSRRREVLLLTDSCSTWSEIEMHA